MDRLRLSSVDFLTWSFFLFYFTMVLGLGNRWEIPLFMEILQNVS